MLECIHCGQCTNNCEFLKKYDIDIEDLKERVDLRYRCFLCGKCEEVCPVGIDGKQIVLELRKEMAEEAKLRKEYATLLWEKDGYKFQNYKKGTKKSVFFPGCNFPGYYPKTTKVLEKIFEEAGCGVVYDCCGKPVAELGLSSAEKNLREMEEKLMKCGVEELIIACPNCYEYLKGQIQIPVVTIYEKLAELGVLKEDQKLSMDGKVFLPCPDRKEKFWLHKIQPFFATELEHACVRNVQCCGLGGCASGKEPEISEGFEDAVRAQLEMDGGELPLYTYCASCSGKLSRKASDVRHILTVLLHTEEKPDTKKSVINRAKHRIV